jgi:hypothetical protein
LSEVGREPPLPSDTSPNPPSLAAECYQLARELEGEVGASVVAKAFRVDCLPAEEVMEGLCEAAESGERIAYILWRP